MKAPYSRSRVLDLTVHNSAERRYKEVFWDGRTVDTLSQIYPGLIDQQYIHDVVTPGFNELRGQGKIISNPMQKRKTTRVYSPYQVVDVWSTRFPNGLYNSTVSQGPYFASRNSVDSNYPVHSRPYDVKSLQDAVIIEAFARMNDHDWSSVIDFAEAKETFGMIGQYLKPLVKLATKKPIRLNKNTQKLLKSSVKGNRKYFVRNTADIMSNNWLEYRYGWGPAMYSISDAAKAYARLMNSLEPVRQSFRAHDQREDSIAGQNTSMYFPFGASRPGIPHVFARETSYSIDVRAGVMAHKEVNLRNALGLRLIDIPSHAIELVPLSFVASWFVNLDRFIRANTPQSGTKVLSSWCTTRETIIDRVIPSRQAKGSNNGISGTGYQSAMFEAYEGLTQVTTETVDRMVGVSPLRPLTVNTQFHSTNHVLDSLALITGRLRR